MVPSYYQILIEWMPRTEAVDTWIMAVDTWMYSAYLSFLPQWSAMSVCWNNYESLDTSCISKLLCCISEPAFVMFFHWITSLSALELTCFLIDQKVILLLGLLVKLYVWRLKTPFQFHLHFITSHSPTYISKHFD